MAQHYNINVDINDLIDGKIDKTLRGIQRAIDRGSKKGIRKCEENLKVKLLENMIDYGLGMSNLSGTIESYPTEFGLSIRMGSEYFMFVEYGTGIVGRNNPHPDTSKSMWKYDTNEHGETGWWYPSSIDDPNPTAYRNKLGEWWAWTKGQAARPFMYETWLWGMENAARIISDEIGKEIKKLERRAK